MSKKIEGDGLKYTFFYLIIVLLTFSFFSLIFNLKDFEIVIIILSITFYSIHSVFRNLYKEKKDLEHYSNTN